MALNDDIIAWLNEQRNSGKWGGLTFVEPAPIKRTTKLRNGQWSKHPLIGGERSAFVDAYMGKRKGVILCFKPEDWGGHHEDDQFDTVQMEIPLSEMPDDYVFYGVTVKQLKAGKFPGASSDRGAMISGKSAFAERYRDNPNWGSW